MRLRDAATARRLDRSEKEQLRSARAIVRGRRAVVRSRGDERVHRARALHFSRARRATDASHPRPGRRLPRPFSPPHRAPLKREGGREHGERPEGRRGHGRHARREEVRPRYFRTSMPSRGCEFAWIHRAHIAGDTRPPARPRRKKTRLRPLTHFIPFRRSPGCERRSPPRTRRRLRRRRRWIPAHPSTRTCTPRW